MKNILLISLLLAVLMQTFAKSLAIVNFKFNQEFIAKNLCENRFKKKSCCHGSCQLKKKLSEDDKNEKVPNSSNSKDKFEELFCEKKSDFKINLNKNYELQFPIAFNSLSVLYSKGIFHPPCC